MNQSKERVFLFRPKLRFLVIGAAFTSIAIYFFLDRMFEPYGPAGIIDNCLKSKLVTSLPFLFGFTFMLFGQYRKYNTKKRSRFSSVILSANSILAPHLGMIGRKEIEIQYCDITQVKVVYQGRRRYSNGLFLNISAKDKDLTINEIHFADGDFEKLCEELNRKVGSIDIFNYKEAQKEITHFKEDEKIRKYFILFAIPFVVNILLFSIFNNYAEIQIESVYFDDLSSLIIIVFTFYYIKFLRKYKEKNQVVSSKRNQFVNFVVLIFRMALGLVGLIGFFSFLNQFNDNSQIQESTTQIIYEGLTNEDNRCYSIKSLKGGTDTFGYAMICDSNYPDFFDGKKSKFSKKWKF